MNGLLKKVLTVALSTTMLTSVIPFGGANVVAAQGYNGYVEQEIKATETYENVTSIATATLEEVDGVYSVASASDWEALVSAGQDYAGKTVVLTEDITFTDANSSLAAFAGTLDGNGHTLKGVTNPLILSLNGGAKIKNLIVDGAEIESDAEDVAVLASTATVSADIQVTDVAIKNATVKGATKTATGLIGHISAGPAAITLTNCTVSGSINGIDVVAGLIGRTTSKVVITINFNNCKNSAELVTTATEIATSVYMGGMIAYVGQSQTAKITDCTNSGSLFVDAGAKQDCYIGGFVGRIRSGLTVENSCNEGDVSVKLAGRYAYIGGLVGYNDTVAASFTNCVNAGNVASDAETTAQDFVGGFIGVCYFATTIQDSVNYGDITAAVPTAKSVESNGMMGGCAGGIVGVLQYNKSSTFVLEITNTFNMGTVLSLDGMAGGIVAQALNPVVLDQCVNTGDVFSGVEPETKEIVKTGSEHRTAAGMLGGTRNAKAVGSSIKGCINTGWIVAPRTAGGMVGYIKNGSTTFTIENCSNSGNLDSNDRTGGIIADSNTDLTVKNCFATGVYGDGADTEGEHIGAIGGRVANITMEGCYGSVTLNGFYTAWIGGEAVEKTEEEMLAELAVLNLEVQKGAADENGKFNALVLAGMNKLTQLTKVGFEVIRVVDGKISKLGTNGTSVYTDVFGYDENGAKKEVYANEYANVKYFSALEINNISNTENVTYLYRAYAVKTVDNVETTLYGTWSAVSFEAVA